MRRLVALWITSGRKIDCFAAALSDYGLAITRWKQLSNIRFMDYQLLCRVDLPEIGDNVLILVWLGKHFGAWHPTATTQAVVERLLFSDRSYLDTNMWAESP